MTSKLLTGISAVLQALVVVRIPGCARPKPRLTLTNPGGSVEASDAGYTSPPTRHLTCFLSNHMNGFLTLNRAPRSIKVPEAV
jgi:hypothetical protein